MEAKWNSRGIGKIEGKDRVQEECLAIAIAGASASVSVFTMKDESILFKIYRLISIIKKNNKQRT